MEYEVVLPFDKSFVRDRTSYFKIVKVSSFLVPEPDGNFVINAKIYSQRRVRDLALPVILYLDPDEAVSLGNLLIKMAQEAKKRKDDKENK